MSSGRRRGTVNFLQRKFLLDLDSSRMLILKSQ